MTTLKNQYSFDKIIKAMSELNEEERNKIISDIHNATKNKTTTVEITIDGKTEKFKQKPYKK